MSNRHKAAYILAAIFCAFLLVKAAHSIWAETECLEAGYHHARTTWLFDSFCVDLHGNVQGLAVKPGGVE